MGKKCLFSVSRLKAVFFCAFLCCCFKPAIASVPMLASDSKETRGRYQNWDFGILRLENGISCFISSLPVGRINFKPIRKGHSVTIHQKDGKLFVIGKVGNSKKITVKFNKSIVENSVVIYINQRPVLKLKNDEASYLDLYDFDQFRKLINKMSNSIRFDIVGRFVGDKGLKFKYSYMLFGFKDAYENMVKFCG